MRLYIFQTILTCQKLTYDCLLENKKSHKKDEQDWACSSLVQSTLFLPGQSKSLVEPGLVLMGGEGECT